MARTSAPSSPIRSAFAIGGGLIFAGSLGYFAWQYAAGFDAQPAAIESRPAVLVDVALFSVFALHHSVFARTRVKMLIAALAGPTLERSVYVWIASLLFLAVCGWWQPVAGVLWSAPPPWAWALRGMQLAGALLTLAAARHLDVLALAGVAPALGRPPSGHGLDDRGPYGVVRHPIYFAWLLLVWPAPEMTGTRLVFAITSTVYLLMAIPYEERDLRRTFGSDYDQYSGRVRWKILPGIH